VRTSYDQDVDDAPLPDFAVVEAAVGHAVRTGDTSALRLLGHGEISIVLGWPADAPEHAVKRVPPFRTAAAAQQYIDVCERNLALLRAAGVAVWPTTFHTTRRDDGTTVVYHRQPVGDPSRIGSNVLRGAEPADAHPLLDEIVRAARAVVTPSVGLDVQVANWIWDGVTAHQIDFTSPFLLNESRDDLQFDTRGFLREYPVVLRPLLRRELVGLVRRFTTPEGALGDMIGNLQKEGLHQWVTPAIDAAARQGVHIDKTTTTKMFEDDKKLMPLTLRLKKAQRWWVSHTGRRYDSLLPERTTYEA
jgi:hypothetical protein